MKNSLSVLFLSFSLAATAQYKHFTAGIFGTTHNFDSHTFYSSPGVSFQYNFNRIFSLHVAFSEEKMKRSSLTFNDLNSDYYHSNLTLSYWNIPMSCRATFGRKFLVYVEAGLTNHSKYTIHRTGFITNNFDGEPDNETYTQEYTPEHEGSMLLFGGAGAFIPIARGFSLEN